MHLKRLHLQAMTDYVSHGLPIFQLVIELGQFEMCAQFCCISHYRSTVMTTQALPFGHLQCLLMLSLHAATEMSAALAASAAG